MYSEAKTIGIIFLLVAATFSCTNLQKEKEVVNEELPNIVLLLGDELGWDEDGLAIVFETVINFSIQVTY
jgi:hypothetical protein